MRGQKYWEEKVPVYTEIKEVREQRRQRYLSEAKNYYPHLEEITNYEYKKIKQHLEDDNTKKRLMELSIQPIIDALAGIYAKYDIEEVVPFEEGLSYVLNKFNKSLKNFTSLPDRMCEYSVSALNYYAFNVITFYYQFMKYDAKNIEYLSNNELIWKIDKLDHEEFSYKDVVKGDVRNRIIKVMSKLNARQARVLALRYGLFDGCEKTYEEIAESENVSRSRADKIIIQALRNIRKRKNIKPLLPYQDKDLDLI